MKNTIIAYAIAVVALFGCGYLFGKLSSTPSSLQVSSPAGTTFNTAKFYGIAVNLANSGSNGTSTSLTNGDANDRYISGFRAGCSNVGTSLTGTSGTGLIALKLSIGTTSTAAPATFLGYAPITTGFVMSTSTPNLIVASSTLQIATSSAASIWHSGEILTFYFNATNTAVCTVGVDAMGS